MSTEEFQDFSYVTQWERFAGEIEQELRRWLWTPENSISKENCVVEMKQKLHFRKEPYILSIRVPGGSGIPASPAGPVPETSGQESEGSYFSISETEEDGEEFEFAESERASSAEAESRTSVDRRSRSNPVFSKGLFVSPMEHFAEEATTFQLWFGVDRFVLLSGGHQSGRLVDAQEASTVLSAASVALSEFPRPMPILVPVSNAFRDAYRGVAVVGGRSVFFEIDSSHLTQQAEHLRSVAGQLQVFAKQLHVYSPKGAQLCDDLAEGVPTRVEGYEIGVSSCVVYKLPLPWKTFNEEHVVEADADKQETDAVAAWNEEWDNGCVWQPWAAEKDPIAALELDLVWDNVRLTAKDPTPVLSAKNAAAWRIYALAEERRGFESWSIFSSKKTFDRRPLALPSSNARLESEFVSEYDGDNFRGLFARLQALHQATLISKGARSVHDLASEEWWYDNGTHGPNIPPQSIFDDSLSDMFGDDFDGMRLWTMTRHIQYDDVRCSLYEESTGKACPLSRLFPMQSLTSRLGMHTVVYRNARAVALLWGHFVRCIREQFWEKLNHIPLLPQEKRDSDTEPEAPDFNACLIHQKLQLLNICIHRLVKKRRMNSIETCVSEDHEFNTQRVCKADYREKNSDEPRGVAGVLNGASIENHPDIAVNIPVTQQMPVHTSDSLIEEETLLSALHDNPEDHERAARVQSRVLISDMAAFKAANPSAQLGDFVKWHSPKDWVKRENGEGCLSQRMAGESGNRWAELWKSVEPQPAAEQIPLFDPAVAGERALHFLETIEPVKLFWQLLQIALVSCFACLQRSQTAKLKRVREESAVFYTAIKEGLGQTDEPPDHVIDLLERFRTFERLVVSGESLTRRLPGCPMTASLLFDLLVDAGESVEDGKEYECRGITVPESEKNQILSLLLRPSEESSAVQKEEEEEETKVLYGTVLQHEWVLTCQKSGFEGNQGRLFHRLYFKDAANEVRLGTVLVSEL